MDEIEPPPAYLKKGAGAIPLPKVLNLEMDDIDDVLKTSTCNSCVLSPISSFQESLLNTCVCVADSMADKSCSGLSFHTLILAAACRTLRYPLVTMAISQIHDISMIFPETKTHPAGPRNSVSAEAYGQFNPEKVFVPPVYPKSEVGHLRWAGGFERPNP